ncbi:MAG: hypothetical protein U0263_05540 [Polyangiaceae bacterium]
MKYDGTARSLAFSSQEEAEAFHTELSALIRGAMVGATRHIEDAQVATEASREVMKEFHTLFRALNVLRGSGALERKGQ